MSAGWAWAHEVLERAVAPLPGGYLIETVGDDRSYWSAWDAAFGREGFPPEVYFARSPEREEKAERLAASRGGTALVDRWPRCIWTAAVAASTAR